MIDCVCRFPGVSSEVYPEGYIDTSTDLFGLALKPLLPCVFCDLEPFSEKQSKSYCIRGTNRYSTHVATKKFSERLTRVVRQNGKYDDERSESNR